MEHAFGPLGREKYPKQFLKQRESTFIKTGVKHRLSNSDKLLLEIIEVQFRDYVEEDNIVRFDDEYGRK
ncbi:MAG: hypothetical protein K8R11_02835 [Methanococcoides sp.]|nr:hypothetical protein [Methanococcoides sp.]